MSKTFDREMSVDEIRRQLADRKRRYWSNPEEIEAAEALLRSKVQEQTNQRLDHTNTMLETLQAKLLEVTNTLSVSRRTNESLQQTQHRLHRRVSLLSVLAIVTACVLISVTWRPVPVMAWGQTGLRQLKDRVVRVLAILGQRLRTEEADSVPVVPEDMALEQAEQVLSAMDAALLNAMETVRMTQGSDRQPVTPVAEAPALSLPEPDGAADLAGWPKPPMTPTTEPLTEPVDILETAGSDGRDFAPPQASSGRSRSKRIGLTQSTDEPDY